MKMSRAERKAFNYGKKVGYLEGYAKGVYDGNPFNKILETVQEMVKTHTKPEIIEAMAKAKADGGVFEDEDAANHETDGGIYRNQGANFTAVGERREDQGGAPGE